MYFSNSVLARENDQAVETLRLGICSELYRYRPRGENVQAQGGVCGNDVVHASGKLETGVSSLACSGWGQGPGAADSY
jgi:hypothetical protein